MEEGSSLAARRVVPNLPRTRKKDSIQVHFFYLFSFFPLASIFGQINPYIRFLLDAWTLASKELVYGLVRPNPASGTDAKEVILVAYCK